MKYLKLLLFFGLVLGLQSSQKLSCCNLNINFTNIRSNEGNLFVFVYTYKNQFPHEPYKHFKVNKKQVVNGKLKARISNIQLTQTYAISIIDDENENNDLDRWLGMPTEGYGFSNNITPFLSLPDYESIELQSEPQQDLEIEVQYFL
ncbi:MAG: DUF2141 domain-containing protein [Putridiphycobacter sp.]